jgi:hypothetical protein
MMPRSKHPKDRYNNDVMGMPVFAAEERFVVLLSPESMRDAIPQDDENCAIALGCKAQLQSPYVSVGRSRTDLAMPHPEGIEKPGYVGKWAVIRFANSQEARKVIVAADTGQLPDDGAVVELLPAGESIRPMRRRQRNQADYSARKAKGGTGRAGPQSDDLTLMGVRTLTGQRKR